MKDKIIVSDFDGTITKKDTLYHFFIENAPFEDVHRIGSKWERQEISSQECLIKEFQLVKNLSEKLVNDFISTVEIDEGFLNFNEQRIKNNIDFVIVSDGLDYFIKKVLAKHNLFDTKIITNHAEFRNNEFKIEFPNEHGECVFGAGTCKCQAIKELRKNYDKIYYIGDGVSDFCVANKADKVFAKGKLYQYCTQNSINCTKYNNFYDLTDIIFKSSSNTNSQSFCSIA